MSIDTDPDVWRNDDIDEALNTVHLSFTRQDESSSDNSSSEDEDDFEEISLPVCDANDQNERMTSLSVGPTLRWAAQQILTLEEQVKLDTANTLLSLRAQSVTAKQTYIEVPCETSEELDAIFSATNEQIQKHLHKQVEQQHVIITNTKSLHSEHSAFAVRAEAAIAAFMHQQAEAREIAENAEKERLRIAHAERERLKAETEKAAAVAQAHAESVKIEAASSQKKAEAMQRSITAISQDQQSLFPTIKNRKLFSAFGRSRIAFFKAVLSTCKEAPFQPDQKMFLEVNEVLGKFVPNPKDEQSSTSAAKELVKIIQNHQSDMHCSNLASSFLKQVKQKVFQQPDLASGFARLWHQLERLWPRISFFIMAGVFTRCPPTTAIFTTGKIYTDNQANCLRAYLRVFSAYVQLSQGHMGHGWNWLSCVLPSFTGEGAAGVLMFLEVSELLDFSFFRTYGRQGMKLIRFMAKQFVPQLPHGDGACGLNTDVKNLSTFLSPDVIRSSASLIKSRKFIVECLQ